MLAIDDSASIFWARLIRGTISIAMTLAPLALAASMPSSFPPGLKKEIRVLPLVSFFSSSASGWRTLAMISASFQSALAVFLIVTPASL